MAKIGWAYELKTASTEMVRKRALRTGDGTRPCEDESKVGDNEHVSHGGDVWGWGDANMKEEDIKDVKIFNKLD